MTQTYSTLRKNVEYDPDIDLSRSARTLAQACIGM